MKEAKVDLGKKSLIIIAGAFIFCFGINVFIVPVGLYNGGVVGIAQIIRTLISDSIGVSKNVDISGIINFIFNYFVFCFRIIFLLIVPFICI